MKSRGHNLGVIEYHKRAAGQKRGNILEYILADFPVLIAQKLGGIPLRKGIFGYPLIRKRVVVILYFYRRYHLVEILKFRAKLTQV